MAHSRELRPFTITGGATDKDQSIVSTEKKPDYSMPKLWNGVYNAQCSALSPPDLMEAQPKLLPKPRSNSSSSASNRNSKVSGRGERCLVIIPDFSTTYRFLFPRSIGYSR